MLRTSPRPPNSAACRHPSLVNRRVSGRRGTRRARSVSPAELPPVPFALITSGSGARAGLVKIIGGSTGGAARSDPSGFVRYLAQTPNTAEIDFDGKRLCNRQSLYRFRLPAGRSTKKAAGRGPVVPCGSALLSGLGVETASRTGQTVKLAGGESFAPFSERSSKGKVGGADHRAVEGDRKEEKGPSNLSNKPSSGRQA